MAINLSRYKDELLAAWRDVLDDKTSTNWTLFGYEKQTNDLHVVGKGDGGIEELAEELNSGKIMYAFCKVTDPNTGLPKCVLINWQGEGAPLARKGTCANHINDVSKFFKGAHVTMNARTEDDVETSIILEKVAKASATCFNFKDRSEPEENMGPVGTTYRRIHPDREINPTEREKFWLKEEEEERKRIQEEKKKAEEARLKLEQERQEREAKESRAREEWVKERTRSINEMREAERNAENAARIADLEKKQWERQLQEDIQEEQARRARSESLRKERSLEAQTLISQRTINARAVFEQNTCAGQLSTIKYRSNSQSSYSGSQSEHVSSSSPQKSPEKVTPPLSPPAEYKTPEPAPTEPSKGGAGLLGQGDQAGIGVTSPVSNVPQDFTYTRNLLKEGLPPRQESELENPEEEQNWDEPTLEAPPEVKDPLTELMVEHGMSAPQSAQQSPQIITSGSVGQGLRARALYDYQAADDTEISFDPDDIITHIEQIDAGWWQGMAPDGSYGLFPANYVELID